jgi:hypothetical protein
MRALAKDFALLTFGALGAYLIGVVLAGQLGTPLLALVRDPPSALLRLLLAFVVFDLTRAPPLAGIAWLLGPLLAGRPGSRGVSLVLLTYLLEVVVAALLGQLGAIGQRPWLLLGRLVAIALLVAMVGAIFRRRRPA